MPKQIVIKERSPLCSRLDRLFKSNICIRIYIFHCIQIHIALYTNHEPRMMTVIKDGVSYSNSISILGINTRNQVIGCIDCMED